MEKKFENTGTLLYGIKQFMPKDAYRLLMDGAILVDIRNHAEISKSKFNVPQIAYLSHCDFSENYGILNKNHHLIIADSNGLFSSACTKLLLESGYTKVAFLKGGMLNWENCFFPVCANEYGKYSDYCACQFKSKSNIANQIIIVEI